MRPSLLRIIDGNTARVVRNNPRRLVSRISSNSFTLVPANSANDVTPALFTRISTFEWRCSTFLATRSTARSFRTSHAYTSPFAPSSCWRCFSGRRDRLVAITTSPAWTNARASALPMPELAPVIQTVRGERLVLNYGSKERLMRVRNSLRVLTSSRKTPSMALVVATEFCFSTPRIIMQRCRASMTTPTPSGFKHS